jgi:hypothetical protein
MFLFDQRRFYFDKTPFIPVIGQDETCNVAPIELLADLHHDLDWKKAYEEAAEAVKCGKWLFWHFNFGLEKSVLALEDTAQFFSFTIAIEEFLKQLWPVFGEKTFGASVYRGSIDIASRFLWSHAHEKHFKESLLDEHLYCVDVFAEYLHRLSSYFPDNLLAFCFFDTSFCGPAQQAQLLSKERFAHFHLAVKGAHRLSNGLIWKENKAFFEVKEVSKGVLLPSDALCCCNVLMKVDALVEQFSQKGEALRIIPEMLFNEEWDGLDVIFAMEDVLTIQGRRRLQGFAAAGGEIVFV